MMIIFDPLTTVPIFVQIVPVVAPGVHEAGMKTTPVEFTEYVSVPVLFGESVPPKLMSEVPVTAPPLNAKTPDLTDTFAVCGSNVPTV